MVKGGKLEKKSQKKNEIDVFFYAWNHMMGSFWNFLTH